MQNTIERSIDIAAPLDRVWDLVTEPGWWVPNDGPSESERTAGTVVMRESEKWGRFPVEIVELRPKTYAAFRWSSTFPNGELEAGRTTLIEFSVEPTDTGARVSVVESGFAELDAAEDVRARSIESNTGGWRDELASLRTRAEA